MKLPGLALGVLGKGEKIVFVDVGARGSSLDLKQLAPIVKYYGFEPDSVEYERLVKSSADADYASVEYDNHALHSRSGKGTLFVTESPTFSSLLEPNLEVVEQFPYWHATGEEIGSYMHIKDRVSVPITTLNAVAKNQFNLEHIDYLKLDTQGNELDILKGADQLLDKCQISVIRCEVWLQSFYQNQGLFSDIDALLRRKGFMFLDIHPVNKFHKVNTLYPPSDNDRGILYFSDAYYCLDIDTLAARFEKCREGILKCGLVMISLGYIGWGYEILRRLGNLEGKKIEQLCQVMNRVPRRNKLIPSIKQILPPVIVDMLRKFM